jgi:hypothetical protein
MVDEDGGTAVLVQQLPASPARQERAGVGTHASEGDEALPITRGTRAHQVTDEAALSAEGDTE